MTRPSEPDFDPSDHPEERHLDRICEHYRSLWKSGQGPRIEDFLEDAPDDERASRLSSLLKVELTLLMDQGELPSRTDYETRFSGFEITIEAAFFEVGVELRGSAMSTQFDSEADGGSSASNRETWTDGSPSRSGGPFRVGRTVGDYRILRQIGRGGMGVVFLARQLKANRLVALKVIKPELVEGPDREKYLTALKRFTQEAQAAASLFHKNIVTLHEVGVIDERHFYTMRYVDGESLSTLLIDGPLSNDRAAEILEPLAWALHEMHQADLIHRDLKPSNILIDKEWQPYLADFGLSKWLSVDSGVTLAGERLGTPSYMSPEQARGDFNVSAASDVYSMGATLYEMLTGRPPFRAADPLETMRQVKDESPVVPRKFNRAISRDLETICLKCLEKDPKKRYQSARDLATDLSSFRKGLPIQARRAGPLERSVKWARRRPSVAGLIAACLLLVSLLTLGVVREQRQERDRRLVALVDRLESAEIGRVFQVVGELGEFGPRSEELIAQRLKVAPPHSRSRINLAIAGLPFDPKLSVELGERLLKAGPDEISVILEALRPQARTVAASLAEILGQDRTESAQRLRAACALANLAPGDPSWRRSWDDVAFQLLAIENRYLLGEWMELFRPARLQLIPSLTSAFRRAEEREEREAASYVLASYLDDVPTLIGLIEVGSPEQVAALVARINVLGDRSVHKLELALDASKSADPSPASLGRRANLALALLTIGRGSSVWPLLHQSKDNSLRTELIHRFSIGGLPARILTDRFEVEVDASIRSSLLLSLGEYSSSQLPPGDRARLRPLLRGLFHTNPDPAIHSAIEWLLKRWGEDYWVDDAEKELASKEPKGSNLWYVNGQGHTMAVVKGPVTFAMGSPEGEPLRMQNETLHDVRIGRNFAISTRETTLEQFMRWKPEHQQVGEIALDPASPVNNCKLQDVIEYCRWLTLKEGMGESDMCYPPIEIFLKNGLRPYDGYLSKSGYRLPTEAEWEFACRAGSDTSFPFGSSETHLPRYCQSFPHAMGDCRPVGRLKPNDLGLFDMLGNVVEWTQASYLPYPTAAPGEVIEDRESFDGSSQRVIRGGAFFSAVYMTRSARRYNAHYKEAVTYSGFRVARTLNTSSTSKKDADRP